MRIAGGLVVLLAAVALFLGLRADGSSHPGPFYSPPPRLTRGAPGTIIRVQPIPNLYPGAEAYRVLYRSAGLDGRPAAASGLIVVPEGPAPRHGRPVIAFAHGAVGVARACAPSLLSSGAGQVIEGLGEFIAAGDVVVASDYVGLGTSGAYPYLSGTVAARNTLDIVRAVHHLAQAHAGVSFAVWGHSQGGQAALFTAQLAPTYAPGLHLVGVAAGAPVGDPASLFRIEAGTAGGKLLISMELAAWSRAYGDPGLLSVVAPSSRRTVADVAGGCLYGNAGTALAAEAAQISFTSSPPWHDEPWRRIRVDATPGRTPIGVPVLLVQGGADKLVPPGLTARLARSLCAGGGPVELRMYPTAEHAEAGIVASPDVASWVAQRFAGAPAPSTCSGRG
jgi:pimeloyl-ACP methyl ester carboxylesterase